MRQGKSRKMPFVDRDIRLAIYERDGYRCWYCGKMVIVLTSRSSIKPGHSLFEAALDHIIPQSKGGAHLLSNLITCCKSCNSAKGDRDLDQYRTYVRSRLPEQVASTLLAKAVSIMQERDDLLPREFVERIQDAIKLLESKVAEFRFYGEREGTGSLPSISPEFGSFRGEGEGSRQMAGGALSEPRDYL